MLFWLVACGDPPQKHPKNNPETTTTETTEEETTPTEDTTTPVPTGDTGPSGPASVLQFDGDPPQNLIMISLDTTRRDFIGRFAGNGNTPNLDAKLIEGVALDNHRSCSSWTGPSMTCVTTGRSPFDLGWFPWTSDYDVPDWDDDLPTIAGQLQFQKGFRTALVTANAVMGPYLPLDRGYQVVHNLDYQPAEEVTDTALQSASELLSMGDPFFLHVHYMDPHEPYCPPEDYVDQGYGSDLEEICNDFWYTAGGLYYQSPEQQDAFLTSAREIYDAELDYWDDEFQRLWDGLSSQGALDDALIVFVTDHGEQFYERGAFGHGNTLSAEENRSTAMFWSQTILPQVWSEPTTHEDIGTTIVSYFGLAPPEPVTGVEVGLAPPDRYLRSMLYWGCCGSAQLSVTRGDLQLTYNFWGEKHLWDYSLDETGTIDYYDPEDPDVIAMWVEMEAYVNEVLAQWPSSGPASYVGP